jgi:hypothetical protein
MADTAVEFREVMRGAFASGATDPEAGERDGRRVGSYLTLHATAAIPNVPQFVRDPEHTGRLSGTVTFPAIGAREVALSGAFNLFMPSSDRDLKLMSYRATFRVAGAEYCLDGAKQVRRHSVLRAWTDTTTLYCRLHEGADTSGRVTAAGVLRLRPLAFARQLTSFRTPSASGVTDTVRALSGFFSFFAGEVIDSYLRPRSRPSRS